MSRNRDQMSVSKPDVGPCNSIFAEQRIFYEGKSFVILNPSRVLRLTGEDRLNILHLLSTQNYPDTQQFSPKQFNTEQSPPGQSGISSEALFLNPQGRIMNRAGVLDTSDCVWLFCDSDALATQLSDYLLSMRFTLRFEIERLDTKNLFLCAGFGELPESIASWHDPWPQVQPGGYSYAPQNLEQPVWRLKLFLCTSQPAVHFVGADALSACEIAAGRPSMHEVDDLTLPHELDWLRTAVHLKKGCYRGQELVAKLHNLGRPPRRMVRLALDGQVPLPGSQILCDGKQVGCVTRSANHWELGPVALGIIKRSTPEGEVLLVESEGAAISASAETLVSPESGSVASVPRMKKLI